MKRIVVLLIIALVIAVPTYLIINEWLYGDVAQIKFCLRGSVRAVNERDVPKLMSHVAANYRDNLGNRNRQTLEANAQALMSRIERGSLDISSIKVDVAEQGGTATARLTARGKPARGAGAVLRVYGGRPMSFEMDLVKNSRVWRICSARHAKYTIR